MAGHSRSSSWSGHARQDASFMVYGLLPTSHEWQDPWRRGAGSSSRSPNWPTWGDLTVGWGQVLLQKPDWFSATCCREVRQAAPMKKLTPAKRQWCCHIRTPVQHLKDYEDVKRKYEIRLLDILYSQPHSLMVAAGPILLYFPDGSSPSSASFPSSLPHCVWMPLRCV